MLKVGSRLKSTVCTTEAMVIAIASDDLQISCGGALMADASDASDASGNVQPEFSEGCLLGKRYVNADSNVELLCVKAGEGSLSIDGVALTLKDAKPLPSSD